MGRNFASQTTDQVSFSVSTIPYNTTTATFLCWFRHPGAPTSGNLPGIVSFYGAFNRLIFVMMEVAGANNGKITVYWRSGSGEDLITSTTAYDDNAWHRLQVVRRSTSPYVELYIDGVSVASGTTDPGTDATALINALWGTVDPNDAPNSSWGGDLARCMYFTSALTVEEGESILLSNRLPVTPHVYHEMGQASPEPDWSGNGRSGTVTGATVGAHAPCGPWFGFDESWAAWPPSGHPAQRRLGMARFGRPVGIGSSGVRVF